MISKFLTYFSAFAFAACFSSVASAIECPTGQQDYNGVCKYLRTTSTAPAPFVPVAVRNNDNIFLYPTAMPAKCATAQADSDCMVAYSYTDTSLPPVISASFTNTAPVAGSTSTSPQWTSTNAVSMSISCSGVASSYAGIVGVQGTPSGITFTSSAAGIERCVFTATNPFGISSTATISVNFAAAPPATPPPTISVSRTPLPFTAGQNHSITWSTTNATSVNQVCTSTGTGYTYSGPQALNGGSTGVASAAWIGYPTRCVWTATGPGGTASAVDDFSTVATPPTPVYRFQGGGIYFWTSSPEEYQALATTYAYYWTYEGIAFNVYNTPSAISGLLPVYRFWTDYGGRYYTQNEAEKNALISGYPSFHYEGVAWYALPATQAGTVPLYQFFNTSNSTHFFTASAAEKDWIRINIPSWTYQGISQYVWP